MLPHTHSFAKCTLLFRFFFSFINEMNIVRASDKETKRIELNVEQKTTEMFIAENTQCSLIILHVDLTLWRTQPHNVCMPFHITNAFFATEFTPNLAHSFSSCFNRKTAHTPIIEILLHATTAKNKMPFK